MRNVVVLLFLAACAGTFPTHDGTNLRSALKECPRSDSRFSLVGDTVPDGLSVLNGSIARSGGGWIAVVAEGTRAVLVFDSFGIYSRQVFITRGTDTLANYWLAPDGSGSLQLFSEGGVVTLLDDRLGLVRQYQKQLQAGPPERVAVLLDGSIAFTTRKREGVNGSMLLRFADGMGSIGGELDLADNSAAATSLRISRSRTGVRTWVARSKMWGGIRVQLVDNHGVIAHQFDRNPDWWPQTMELSNSSFAADVREVRDGSLVLAYALPLNVSRSAIPVGPKHLAYTSVVEIVGAKSDRPLQTCFLAGYPLQILDDDHIATIRMVSGKGVIDIWTLAR